MRCGAGSAGGALSAAAWTQSCSCTASCRPPPTERRRTSGQPTGPLRARGVWRRRAHVGARMDGLVARRGGENLHGTDGRSVLRVHATCNVQDATCKLQRARYNVQDATCKIQGARCHMHEARCKVQDATCNRQEATLQRRLANGRSMQPTNAQRSASAHPLQHSTATVSAGLPGPARRVPLRTAAQARQPIRSAVGNDPTRERGRAWGPSPARASARARLYDRLWVVRAGPDRSAAALPSQRPPRRRPRRQCTCALPRDPPSVQPGPTDRAEGSRSFGDSRPCAASGAWRTRLRA
jgi:hypothetical protein